MSDTTDEGDNVTPINKREAIKTETSIRSNHPDHPAHPKEEKKDWTSAANDLGKFPATPDAELEQALAKSIGLVPNVTANPGKDPMVGIGERMRYEYRLAEGFDETPAELTPDQAKEAIELGLPVKRIVGVRPSRHEHPWPSAEPTPSTDIPTPKALALAQGRARARQADTPGTQLLILIGVALIGAAGFAISYGAIYEISGWTGWDPWQMILTPLLLDAGIVVFTFLSFIRMERGESTVATFLLAEFLTVASSTAQVIHTLLISPSTGMKLMVACIISALPPLILSASSYLAGKTLFRKSS